MAEEWVVIISAEQARQLCQFPERLHPVSETILDDYLSGKLLAHEFLRFFSLPNSDYIPLARCFVELLASAGG